MRVARDNTVVARRGIVGTMRQNPVMRSLIGDPPRFYGPSPPAGVEWPFCQLGTPTVSPFQPSGCDGSELDFILHAFARGDDEGNVADLAGAALRELESSMPITVLDGLYPAKLEVLEWRGTQYMRDPVDAKGWHAIVNLRLTVVS